MPGLGRKGEVELDCPFCKKAKVRTFHKEGYLQAHVSRISAGAKTKYSRQNETYQVLEDCPECGALKKDIQDFYEGKYRERLSHEERIKRFKQRGLSLVLESGG